MAGKRRPELSLAVFRTVAVIVILGAVFLTGLISGASRNAAFRFFDGIRESIAVVWEDYANPLDYGKPVHFLQPSRKPGDGVTINLRPDDGGLIMLSGFFDGGNETRLIRRDGTVVARWPVRFSAHFPNPTYLNPPPATDWNVDLHGALLNPDGSLVFVYEYSGMVKLDRCGKVLWKVARPIHHSLEPAAAGGYWTLDRRVLTAASGDPFPPFTPVAAGRTLEDDMIARVSDDGRIVEERSIARILYDNGLQALLTATGLRFDEDAQPFAELVHANSVSELSPDLAAAFPEFDAGDLVVSLRKRNLVFVVDPRSWRVKWHQTGPWLRQHDAAFGTDGTISVFNNNTFYNGLDENDRTRLDRPFSSNVLAVNPDTGKARVLYGSKPGQEMLSVIRGKHQRLSDGGLFVTEFEAGRAFEADDTGRIVWEYINRYDADNVLEMTQARLYPRSYFTVQDWTCPG